MAKRRRSQRAAYAQTYFPPPNVALVCALQKDAGGALEWLEEAERQKDPRLMQIVHDPEYEFLRREPRLQTRLQKLNL